MQSQIEKLDEIRIYRIWKAAYAHKYTWKSVHETASSYVKWALFWMKNEESEMEMSREQSNKGGVVLMKINAGLWAMKHEKFINLCAFSF